MATLEKCKQPKNHNIYKATIFNFKIKFKCLTNQKKIICCSTAGNHSGAAGGAGAGRSVRGAGTGGAARGAGIGGSPRGAGLGAFRGAGMGAARSSASVGGLIRTIKITKGTERAEKNL